MRSWLVCSLLALSVFSARAQEDPLAGIEELELAGQALSPQQARQLLAEPLPAEADARYALLQRQLRAAQQLNERGRHLELARQLAEAGRGRPGGEAWIRVYLNAEFTWGSSGAALAACEPWLEDKRLSAATRATVALRQTYYAAQGTDRVITSRMWSRADALTRPLLGQPDAPAHLRQDWLHVRSEVERLEGDTLASLATLREAVGVARRFEAELRKRKLPPRDPELLEAIGWLDSAQGMLVYALVRQGRAAEAIELGQANLALWRSAQLSDSLGARWKYRLATALNAVQQYAPALAAARESAAMLERQGVKPASHTAWLAQQELVRALMGLKRWSEADAAYRAFLASIEPEDTLARNRAQDNRLLALLAAKSGRLDEALDIANRQYNYRNRLYGAKHPQTQESAGVRAMVRLLRGDMAAALEDYEQLFAATLDNPGGWLDLDLRGFRGFVLGLAFGEFIDHVAQRALKGEAVPPALSERALQLADRGMLGNTQRALADSTARLLAATPALRSLLEQEQAQRQAAAAQFAKLPASLAQEDRLHKEMASEAFKALPPAERKARATELSALREQIKAQQAEGTAARERLEQRRAEIARQYPAYADLVMPPTPSAKALRALLEAGEGLLLVHATERATLVWLVTPDGRLGLHASALGAEALAAKVAEARAALAPEAMGKPLQTAALQQLYRELLAPLEPQWRGLDSLLVASEGALASLPLATLVIEPGGAQPAWLLRRLAITQLPAASALQALRRGASPAPAPRALIGFGDPLFGGPAVKSAAKSAAAGRGLRAVGRVDAEWGFRYAEVPPLPETRTELLALAQVLGADPQADLRLGAAATRRAVLAAPLADRRVVAFATHGLMPGELPGISKPALAMAADADERESPLLELDDVLGLRLNAQWVLLSACNTAAGEQGGAAMSGLVRGFFFAGARSVLATHWAVESASAAALSTATFKAAAGSAPGSRAASLRRAQLAMLDGQLGEGRWQHPYYWAGYALFGDPRR
ncbi:CHAT domain-containing protein [Pelomonas sp. V22]|uniref:CHAT domain-containing protein n=1 Tax=Pelomonas sp. V22 TaxID=2822139 RepID=UPI0024A96432|nr:CHAT domain-containing protein [Pelomonas sp. V22]MDI4633885.1 CHAT domain-containing protein [Pelomonas sp. V22]